MNEPCRVPVSAFVTEIDSNIKHHQEVQRTSQVKIDALQSLRKDIANKSNLDWQLALKNQSPNSSSSGPFYGLPLQQAILQIFQRFPDQTLANREIAEQLVTGGFSENGLRVTVDQIKPRISQELQKGKQIRFENI